ncbi:MAG TPA: PrgI family protein [Patescibacteria group bacterium]|nr:PrgI family protein [Patescibacteria group bacterium]
MKTSTVPAQITTVEDKIAGNLSMSQLTLMAAPVFLGGVLYVMFPPFISLTIPKLVLCSLLLVIFFALAIRIRGKIILIWLFVIVRYNVRPRYFLYNKNDAHLRISTQAKQLHVIDEVKKAEVAQAISLPVSTLDVPERVRLEVAIADPRSKLQFLTKRKGGLDVHITEIKQEG